MQNGPSQVTTGSISPAMSGPKKDKDVLVVSGLVVSLAAALGAFWYYSSPEVRTAQDQLNGLQVTEVLKQTLPVATPMPVATMHIAAAGSPKPVTIHTDLYFEPGRKGLTEDARKQLQEEAALLKGDGNLGVLVQGYTDLQGSARYNLQLGHKRAEAVKQELINAGVADHQIKIVSLGKEGAVCIDNSDICRHMNRRVHLEIRAVGSEHMTPAAVASTSTSDAIPGSQNPNERTDEAGSLIDRLLPAANASDGTQDGPSGLEPASGS